VLESIALWQDFMAESNTCGRAVIRKEKITIEIKSEKNLKTMMEEEAFEVM
jgi:hypothetical protein